jgi:hypothetical protein
MAKNLSKALGTDLAGLAQLLRSKGRGKDTILAHINPQEAALLKKAGGSGEPNPETGLPEFQEDYSFGEFYDQGVPEQYDSSGDYSSLSTAGSDFSPEQNAVYGYTGANDAYYPDPEAQVGGYYSGGSSFPEQLQASVPALTTDVESQAGGLYGGQRMIPTNATELAKLQQPPGFLDEFTRQTKTALTKPDTLGRLGLAGGLGLIGAFQNKRLAGQSQAATAEQKAIAQPYTEAGQKLMTQAQAGQLTPQSQASLDAAKARIAQSVAGRGGVGQQQSANQIAQIYNNLLDSQYKYGLQVAQIGDNIALGAIRTGLQMDRSMAQTTNNFYTQLAQIAGGGTYGYVPPTVVRGG